MAIDQCVAKRHDVRSSSSFVECPAALQFFVQFPFCGIFQDQVHTTGVIEVAVQPQDVWMAKVRLDLNLSAQLVLDMGLLKLVFEKDLQCTTKLGSDMSHTSWSAIDHGKNHAYLQCDDVLAILFSS